MSSDFLLKAKEIIEKSQYLNIASVTPDGMPWNMPVYCSYDHELNFYWLSWKENEHSKNIRNNAHVFVTMYDSTIREGTGCGVYLQGQAYELSNPVDILVGLKSHYQRVDRKMRAVALFLKTFPRRVYKFVPDKVWLNGSNKIEDNYIDVRTELDLEELKNIF